MAHTDIFVRRPRYLTPHIHRSQTKAIYRNCGKTCGQSGQNSELCTEVFCGGKRVFVHPPPFQGGARGGYSVRHSISIDEIRYFWYCPLVKRKGNGFPECIQLYAKANVSTKKAPTSKEAWIPSPNANKSGTKYA